MFVRFVSRRDILRTLLHGAGLAAFAGAITHSKHALATDGRVSLMAALKPYAEVATKKTDAEKPATVNPATETPVPEKPVPEKPKPTIARYLLSADDDAPFPILRKKRGDTLALDLTNTLPWPTSFYIDGLRCENANLGIAGLTTAPLAPDAKQALDIALPDCGVYWFAPHNPEPMRPQEASLYGALIVEEDNPPAVADDVLIMLHNQPDDAPNASPQLCINGSTNPLQKRYRPGSRIRLRLVNATASSVLFLGAQGLNATVIGIDGQPCDSFAPARATLPLAPGARYDLLCDLAATPSEVRLLLTSSTPSYPPLTQNLLAQNPLTATSTLGEQARALVIIETAGETLPAPPPLSNLPANPLLPSEIALQKSKRITLTLGEAKATSADKPRYSINGENSLGYAAKPLFSVAKNTPVTLTLVNKTNSLQTIRLCGQVCRVLHQFDDGWEPYWRNSVVVTEGRTMTVVFVPDRAGKWAIESAVDASRLSGLAGWFLVT